MMKKTLITYYLLLIPFCAMAQSMIVTVTNPTSVQRQEVVEIPYSEACQKMGIKEGAPFTVKNAIGQELDYQVTSDNGKWKMRNGQSSGSRKILVDASVQPNGTMEITLEKGIPERMLDFYTQPVRTKAGGFGIGKMWCHGDLYPERLDDIAWENDHGAYRVYGPAFAKLKYAGNGPDIWVKNTPELVLDHRFAGDIDIKPTQRQLEKNGYKKEAAKLVQDNSFHVDHGTGNDCYAVGATLGGGAPAIVYNGDIIYPYCWKEYEILDNGPLRFTVALTFNDTIIGKQKLTEHRIISLDKGSNFNKVEVWYEAQEPRNSETQKLTVVSGFPLHSPNEKTLVLGKDFMQYADPTDNPRVNCCELYLACLYPRVTSSSKVSSSSRVSSSSKVTTKVAFGHALGETTLTPGEHWTYYVGTAWSKYDVRNQQEWQCRINTTLDAIKQPLKVEVK